MILLWVWIAAVYVCAAALTVEHELAMRKQERSVGLRP
jgi:hypothetical protein